MDALPWVIVAIAVCASAALTWVALRARRRLAEHREAANERSSADRALAAADERARIAREMHDVVAHTLAVVVAQSDGGRFAAQKDPAAATRALEVIGDVSRAALADMRGLLGVLRETDSSAAMGPQPTLADIPALIASVRDGGLDVSHVTTGTPRPLPIGAGLAVYRIVQEALTNVLKHAGPSATAYVHLEWLPAAIGVKVSDDGRGAAAPRDGGGTGVEGMRERAMIFGGTLAAGPQAGGGFLVQASIPVPTAGPTKEAQ